jgi:hypothetical protein
MGKTVRSARGVAVDFDMLAIKAQLIGKKDKQVKDVSLIEVKKPENFLDKRAKRKIVKTSSQPVTLVTTEVSQNNPEPTTTVEE